jgi:UDP-glucose 4-epimerase
MNRPIAIVTGGAGFIGSHMVDVLLDNDFEVRVIDNLSGGHERNIEHRASDPRLHFEKADICNLESDSSFFRGTKFVFHFAGIGDIVPSIEHPIAYMQTNVQGTVRVLEASRSAKIEKLVYAASSSCYGLATTTPTREDHPIDPQYPYALSKYQGEQAVFHWNQVYGLPVNSIRIFNAYGTRVRTTGAYGAVFGVFFKQKLAGKPYTVVGNGNQTRDFIYVTDIAKAFLAAAQTTRAGQVYNLGAGAPQRVNRLVELLGGEIVYVPERPGEPDCTWADIRKITNELEWQPTISFEEGVAMMQSEIGTWKDAPLWNPESIEEATKAWFKYMGNKNLGLK